MDDFPSTIVVYLCYTHGLYIEQEDGFGGCPVQVDYDGITCGQKHESMPYEIGPYEA